jgi:HAD superfamily hydrolase (TIGR01509 family)
MQTPRFRGLIFDMDGTLTVPTLDFKAIRLEIGISGGDLATQILQWPQERQRAAWAIIERHEREALTRLQLQKGCAALLRKCRRHAVKLGLVTRNAPFSVRELCRRFRLRFDAVLTREFQFMKPHPGPVLHILAQWDLPPKAVLVVGDYIHDLECGRSAGTPTCFYRNPGFPDWSESADFTVASMSGLDRLVFGTP